MDTVKSPVDTELNIICQVCHHQAKLSEMLKSREVKPGLKEIGAECPKCGIFVHSYFMSDELEIRVGELKQRAGLVRLNRTRHILQAYKDMQTRFQKDFDSLNKKLREKYKVTNGKVSVVSWEKAEVN